GKWKTAKTNGKYLFSVKAMSKVYRGRFIALLKQRLPCEIVTPELINELYKKDWVVYAKRPFGGPQSVIEYLGRYTHKIAISNHRIKNIANDKVTFSYKDYRQSAATKEMDLEPLEFIRRFSMHILPKGFVRIRHYGILSSTSKAACALLIKEQLPPMPEVKNVKSKYEIYNPLQCPCCKKETMQTILRFNRRGPPQDWQQMATNILECIV
ncbi:MAG: transposase, partial [Bacteroidota bacterium]|nr:transposase [Bacteroidota bacterium]